MTKIKERKQAQFYFCEKFLTQKESAKKAGVSEKTMSDWVIKYNWRAKREANFNQTKNQVHRIKEVIAKLTDRNIETLREIEEAEDNGDLKKVEELRSESNKLSQEVAMQTKALQQIDKENRITLSIYLEVMDDVFKSMQADHPDLFAKSIDFQEEHINNISIKLG